MWSAKTRPFRWHTMSAPTILRNILLHLIAMPSIQHTKKLWLLVFRRWRWHWPRVPNKIRRLPNQRCTNWWGKITHFLSGFLFLTFPFWRKTLEAEAIDAFIESRRYSVSEYSGQHVIFCNFCHLSFLLPVSACSKNSSGCLFFSTKYCTAFFQKEIFRNEISTSKSTPAGNALVVFPC